MVVVITPVCMQCGKDSKVEVDDAGYSDWLEGGLLIQEAMPDISKEDRELLLTGTHPECWKKIFGESEDDR